MPSLPLQVAMQFSRETHNKIWSELGGISIESSPRIYLVFAYAAIALDHHEAILSLVEKNMRCSALALLRPQVETVYRELWSLKIATDKQILEIGQEGQEPFPRFKEMAKMLDREYRTDQVFQDTAADWTALNGYTHSGLEQLGFRFKDNGEFSPNYPESMISKLLMFASQMSILSITPLLRFTGHFDKASVLEASYSDRLSLLQRYES